MKIIFLKLFRRTFYRYNWKNLRTIIPISHKFGLDRGTPIDRYYIENFLNINNNFIKGNVLEVEECFYTRKFGKKIEESKILKYTNSEELGVNILNADLTDFSTLPKNYFDCFICTQTFNFIYDYKTAILGAKHLLKSGGVLLATVAGLCQISKYDMERWGDYWRFTDLSVKKVFSEIFGEDNIEIESYGNILTSISILHGISAEELTFDELSFNDRSYQVIITIKATKY